MPFKEMTTPMEADPSIRIFFHGLIVLRSPNGAAWYAETHRVHQHPHTLSVEVRMKIRGQPDLILFRHYGKLPGPHPGMTIKVLRDLNETEVEPQAFKYVPSPSFDPTRPAGNVDNQRDDFRWAVNLEGRSYHHQNLSVNIKKTRPGIEILGGRSVLHTAYLSEDPVCVERNGKRVRELKGLAAVIGANLYLEGGSTAHFYCRKYKDPLKLPKPPANSGISYEIYVNNSPLFVPYMPEHSEMKEYYRVIRKRTGINIPKKERFDLTPCDKVPEGRAISAKVALQSYKASIRIPCKSITLDGTST